MNGGKLLSFSAHDEQADRIDQYMQQRGYRNLSQAIRELVDIGLDAAPAAEKYKAAFQATLDDMTHPEAFQDWAYRQLPKHRRIYADILTGAVKGDKNVG